MLVVMLIHGHFSIAFNKDLHIINPVKNQNGCDIDLTMRNCLRLLIIFKEVFLIISMDLEVLMEVKYNFIFLWK